MTKRGFSIYIAFGPPAKKHPFQAWFYTRWLRWVVSFFCISIMTYDLDDLLLTLLENTPEFKKFEELNKLDKLFQEK